MSNSNTKKITIDFDFVLEKIRKESKNKSELGTRFEKLMKDFFETDKVYKNRFEKVWRWMEWPEREGPDIGIDLVAMERDGSLCAIQCKCYADDASLDERHITNFLAYADGLKDKKFKTKILVYTGDTLTNHANTLLKKHRCTIIQQAHLKSSRVDWSEFPKLSVKDPFTLHKFQEKARDEVLAGFENHDRGKMIMACGTGKTLVSLHVAEKTAGSGGLVLYLVPSISLILQSMREWSENANIKHYYVAVCSDKNAGGEEGTLTELESPVSTDAETLKPFLRNRPKDAMTVIFSTYNSIEVIPKAMKGERFDIIFCDEAHRTTGIEGKSFYTFVHKDENIPSKKRLYMTATPRIYNDIIKAKTGNVLCSMDVEDNYGPEFHRLSFHDAVQKYDALSDFKVKIAIVPADKVDKDFQISVADEDMSMPLDDKTLLAAVWHGIQYPDDDESKTHLLRRIIAFSNRIDRSQMFAGVITDQNDNSRSFEKVVGEFNAKNPTGNHVKVKHIDGRDSALTRRDNIQWLGKSNEDETTCRILSNARCLSEGVDVPALDGVVFLNPRKSVIDVVQSVGRVMRKSQGKEFGYVILPVAIPAGINFNDALDNNETFKIVWQVLNALRSHDEMFAKEINSLILDKKTENTNSITPRISVSILDNLDRDNPPITEMFAKIKSKLIKKVGEYDYYDKYGAKIGKAAATVEARIKNSLETSPELKVELAHFLDSLKKMVNTSVTESDAIKIISQHVILSTIFDSLFSGQFTSHNPISLVLDKMAGKFGLQEELEELGDFYKDVEKEISQITTRVARQNFIKTIYENFFLSTAKKETEQHGVVFTPVEIIDFIINSTEHLLHENFNVGFNNRSVKVLDPFTGTGTFLTRILESGFVDDNIYEKYKHDLYANELILLAYYIATVNIETTYASLRSSGKYVPFDGISYTDTLQLNPRYRIEKRHREKDIPFDDMFKKAHKRVREQSSSHLHVILGNPPYSKGQSSFSDNSPNIEYPEIDKRIRDTYAKKTKTGNINALFDSFVRSFRWASDRMGESGIMAFITNASFISSATTSGLRACLEEEFNEIWCFNLRGDGRITGDGRNIFEYTGKSSGGTRTPVAIIILVKNPKKDKHVIHYYSIEEKYYSGQNKRDRVKELGSIKGIENWEIIEPDDDFDWIDQKIGTFSQYLPMGSKITKLGKENTVFRVYSNGIGTARDVWVYNFSKEELSKNMKRHIEYCAKQDLTKPNVDKIKHDPKQVSWTPNLAVRLQKKKPVFDKNKIRIALYRPFLKQYQYFDHTFNHRVALFRKILPDEKSENLIISITDKGSVGKFSALISDVNIDYNHFSHPALCFPLYVYEDGGKERKENITNTTLEEYRIFYNDKKITKEDIFYYVYGLLHHPKYCEKFANNLSKGFPYISMAPKFWEYVKAGKNLAKLHLNYENCKKYNLGKPKKQNFGNLKKISFGRKTINAKRAIIYSEIRINGILVFDNIPEINYRVNGRTPLEWVVDRYNIKLDKDSGITNDPSGIDIISMIERVVYVGVESDKIIKELPEEFEPKDWKGRKTGLEQFT